MKISKILQKNWDIDLQKPIESQYKWGDTGDIISFIYSPATKEFGIGRRRHKEIAQYYPHTPFQKFVRGIYIKSKGKVCLRAFDIDPVKSFNAQYDTVEALGLQGYKIKFNSSSDELYTQYGWG